MVLIIAITLHFCQRYFSCFLYTWCQCRKIDTFFMIFNFVCIFCGFLFLVCALSRICLLLADFEQMVYNKVYSIARYSHELFTLILYLYAHVPFYPYPAYLLFPAGLCQAAGGKTQASGAQAGYFS